jgi:putative SOS response-associated peptidase YedK
MCNEYARRTTPEQLRAGWGATDVKLIFPEGMPNMPALDSIRITDPAVILRAASGEAGAAEVVTRRWSWPSANGKPVYNFRSDGRAFGNKADSGRCLIPADAFYEYTDPDLPSLSAERDGERGTPPEDLFASAGLARPSTPSVGKEGKKKALKAKWAFRVRGLDWFCVAGLWRTDPQVGQAWTMLTCEPGADIAPYHDRQIVLLTPPDYARWLSGAAPATELCRPLPAGTLQVRRMR